MINKKTDLYSRAKYKSHAEVLNKCFGKKYQAFLPAYKDINPLEAVWFPNLNSSELSVKDDGEYIIVHNSKGKIGFGQLIKMRYVFAREKVDADYSYMGAYGFPKKHGDKTVYRRLSI